MPAPRIAAIFLLVLLCAEPGGWNSAAGNAPGASATEPLLAETLSVSARLSDWGIRRAEDIAYASVGILRLGSERRLVVYDVRDHVPAAQARFVAGRKPPMRDGYFLVDHFDRGIRNHLGGYSSAFARAPSSGELTLEAAPDGRPALTFRYTRARDGFAGFWIHTFDFKSPRRLLLDARETGFLTFLIRGRSGKERLVFRSADDAWERKGDSLVVGELAEFLPSGAIEQRWQRAWVPLERLPDGIDRSRLASFVFSAEQPGSGTVLLRDMALAASREARISAAERDEPNGKPLRKSMWVWETEKIAANTTELSELLSFCRAQSITDVYLQIPEKGPARLRRAVSALHAAGLRVAALDGDPRFALEENHARVLDKIDQVLLYNRGAAANERYDAVRYDNEPYLLPGFAGARKEEIMRGYLRLIEKAHARTKAAGLVLAVDIPFWFDARNRFMEPVAALDGRPLSELVIDRVDEVAIMDYRTVAYGPDGVIAHASDELSYAAKLGKPVYIGLETVCLPDETILDFSAGGGQGARLLISAVKDGEVRLRWIAESIWPQFAESENARAGARTLVQSFVADAPSSKVTFARWPAGRLEQVMEQSARELAAEPSFAGFALHSYESLRPWLAAGGATPPRAMRRQP